MQQIRSQSMPSIYHMTPGLSSSSTAVVATMSQGQKRHQRNSSSSSNNSQIDQYVLLDGTLVPTNLPEEVTRFTHEQEKKQISKSQFINQLLKTVFTITKPTPFHAIVISNKLLYNALDSKIDSVLFERDVIWSSNDENDLYESFKVIVFGSGVLQLSRFDCHNIPARHSHSSKIHRPRAISGRLLTAQQPLSSYGHELENPNRLNQKYDGFMYSNYYPDSDSEDELSGCSDQLENLACKSGHRSGPNLSHFEWKSKLEKETSWLIIHLNLDSTKPRIPNHWKTR
ncbi:unnamed protein product [Ambrosiozyma monospora]|uniref:Unnamed protein product n=1 Tax=Ambrosiozyma monospora TaxID=43982 RepID=A0ACB5U9B3_AMBMO|nr:unnamed protein product [Ambrosiozyma monospora]